MRILICFLSICFSCVSYAEDTHYSTCNMIRESVVQPMLMHLGINDPVLEDLLVGTAAVESSSGRYSRQFGGGPALGAFQIEPRTFKDLKDRGLLLPALYELGGSYRDLEKDLFYGAGVATSFYLWKMRNYDLPKKDYKDQKEYMEYLYSLAAYWKKHFNSYLGAGSKTGFVSAWFRDGCYL